MPQIQTVITRGAQTMNTQQHTIGAKTNDARPHLLRMGWTSHFQTQLDNFDNAALKPARVVGVSKNIFRTSDGQSEWHATTTGNLKHRSDGLYPVTGDWVLMAGTMISAVLVRKNALSRGAAGTHGKPGAQSLREQIIAANLDTVLIVCGLDRDFNLRRLERYLTLVYNCGLKPVIILTKADLHPDPEACADQVERVAFGVPVHLVSAREGQGLAPLEAYLSPGQTVTLVGSSGAGKSTLVNRLCGRTVQATAAVSEVLGKGRHTTTTRDLIMMPQGGMVIDNPGLREIAFWDDDGGIEVAFPEVEALAGECRFADCGHMHEPGCRILQAVAEGAISPDRLASYRKMKRELSYRSQRQKKSADRIEKERWKTVALKINAIKRRGRYE
jgi:ribosome biogenesis GTPase